MTRARAELRHFNPQTTPEQEAELCREAWAKGAAEDRRWRDRVKRADRLHLAALAAERASPNPR